jgi:predicted DNA-binding mobile mystery protein A
MKDGRRKDGCGLSGEALELSLEEVGARLKKPRQRILEFERAEAQDRITLKSLRRVAAALDCNLVYALVPRTDSILELAQQRVRQDATRDVVDVVHPMALEDQAPGNVSQLIDEKHTDDSRSNAYHSRSERYSG